MKDSLRADLSATGLPARVSSQIPDLIHAAALLAGRDLDVVRTFHGLSVSRAVGDVECVDFAQIDGRAVDLLASVVERDLRGTGLDLARVDTHLRLLLARDPDLVPLVHRLAGGLTRHGFILGFPLEQKGLALLNVLLEQGGLLLELDAVSVLIRGGTLAAVYPEIVGHALLDAEDDITGGGTAVIPEFVRDCSLLGVEQCYVSAR